MNSCLYQCSVFHLRLKPKVHRFQHDIFMFYLDLDELDGLARKTFLFSRNRRNLYNFRDDDHEPSGAGSLKERLVGFLRREGVAFETSGRIMLLTLPRVAGYIFNPISIYFCFTPAGEPVCSVAEVGNTFGEKKLYLLGGETCSNGLFCKTMPKHFYVSPFSRLDLDFKFRLGIPEEQLDIRIDDFEGEEKILVSTVTGQRTELNDRNLLWLTLKFPLLTLKVIFLIHWHAFRLWLKRVPFHRKADNPTLQQEVLK